MDIPQEHLNIIEGIAGKFIKKWGLSVDYHDPTPSSGEIIDDDNDESQDAPVATPEENLSELFKVRHCVRIENVIDIKGTEGNGHFGKPQRTWHTMGKEDIEQVAYEAYLRAKASGNKITKAYLNLRISGAILDELRERSGYRPQQGEKKQSKRVKWIPGRGKALPLTSEEREIELQLQDRFIAENGITLCPSGPGLGTWPYISYPIEWYITHKPYNKKVTECYMGDMTDEEKRGKNAPPILVEYIDDVNSDDDNEVDMVGSQLVRDIQNGSDVVFTKNGMSYKRTRNLIFQINGKEAMNNHSGDTMEIMKLRYAGYTQGEVAEKIGLTKRQVRYRIDNYLKKIA